MTRTLFPALFLAVIAGLPAQAEQFAVRLADPFEGARARLMETLYITEIESITEDGAHYVILEAPNAAYVEAFFLATGHDAFELNALEADWMTPAMTGLSLGQRLGFLRPIHCAFCTS